MKWRNTIFVCFRDRDSACQQIPDYANLNRWIWIMRRAHRQHGASQITMTVGQPPEVIETELKRCLFDFIHRVVIDCDVAVQFDEGIMLAR